MNHRERILAAISRQPLDRFPADIWCVPEIQSRLMEHFGASDWVQVLDALDIDGIIHLMPRYIGPEMPDLGPDQVQDEWGMIYRRQQHATGGEYWEQIGYPLADAETIADLDAYQWPKADWYDYVGLLDQIAHYPNRAIMVGYTAIFYYHNKLRGLELSLMDLALRPEFSEHLIRRIADTFFEIHGRSFEAAGANMDLTQVTDDFGSQRGLLIRQAMFERFYRPWMQRAMDQAHQAGVRVFHHDDGAIAPLIPSLLEMGVDVLNPIQWRCPGMDREALGRDYAGKVCFHGAVDNQETLPFGGPQDVAAEVAENLRTLGRTGTAYIIAPCHSIQANTPLENVLALYQADRRPA